MRALPFISTDQARLPSRPISSEPLPQYVSCGVGITAGNLPASSATRCIAAVASPAGRLASSWAEVGKTDSAVNRVPASRARGRVGESCTIGSEASKNPCHWRSTCCSNPGSTLPEIKLNTGTRCVNRGGCSKCSGKAEPPVILSVAKNLAPPSQKRSFASLRMTIAFAKLLSHPPRPSAVRRLSGSASASSTPRLRRER